MPDQSSPELSQPDRATARKALWDLRAEVAAAIDGVMLRRATYATLHASLSAVEARVGQLRLALGTAEAGQPVSGPLRAARAYPEDDPGVNLPPAPPRLATAGFSAHSWPSVQHAAEQDEATRKAAGVPLCPRCRHYHDPEFACSDDCLVCMAEDDPEGAR